MPCISRNARPGFRIENRRGFEKCQAAGPVGPEGWHKSTFLDVGDIFDVLVTADQNIQYQQNLSGRRIALVVLSTNHWGVIRLEIDRVREAIGAAVAGSYLTLSFDRPPLVRRLWPSDEA